MTVSTTAARAEYTGNGSTVAFAVVDTAGASAVIPVVDSSHLKVYVDGTLKTLDIHYTVSINDTTKAATVTFKTSPTDYTPASSSEILILRLVPYTQLQDYVNNDAFDAENVEAALDQLTQALQQIDDDAGSRSLRFSSTLASSEFNTDVDTAAQISGLKADRANKYLSFDANGDITHTESLTSNYTETSIAAGHILRYSGSAWVNSNILALDDTKLYFGTDSNISLEYDENGNDTLSFDGGDLLIEDDHKFFFGSNKDVSIEYDEAGDDTLLFQSLTGTALNLGLFSDAGEDNADKWKLSVADGGTITFNSKISGSYVSHLTITPHATVGSSSILAPGRLYFSDIGGEYIYGDGTDLNLVSGADINITPAGKVGIGTSEPGSYYYDTLTIDHTGSTSGITLKAGTAEISAIAFADGTTGNEQYRGRILYYHNEDRLSFGSAGDTHLHINSSGNVGIGTADLSASARVTITPSAQASDLTESILNIGGLEADDAVGTKNSIGFGYSSAARPIAPAMIGMETMTATGGTYGDLYFATRTVTTNTAPTERMRIASGGDVTIQTGNLVIGSSGQGIDFSNASSGGNFTADGNVLDDYEHGDFEIVLSGSTSGTLTLHSTLKYGTYTRIGNVVHVNGYVNIDAVGSANGTIQLNLPYPVPSDRKYEGAGAALLWSIGGKIGGWKTSGGTSKAILCSWDFYGIVNGAFTGDEEIAFSLTYQVD